VWRSGDWPAVDLHRNPRGERREDSRDFGTGPPSRSSRSPGSTPYRRLVASLGSMCCPRPPRTRAQSYSAEMGALAASASAIFQRLSARADEVLAAINDTVLLQGSNQAAITAITNIMQVGERYTGMGDGIRGWRRETCFTCGAKKDGG
jgi:hypothetical protein